MNWISVKERLPEDDKDVLIHTAFGLYAFATWYDDEWQDSTRVFAGVTHWMTLPEPPEVKVEKDTGLTLGETVPSKPTDNKG